MTQFEALEAELARALRNWRQVETAEVRLDLTREILSHIRAIETIIVQAQPALVEQRERAKRMNRDLSLMTWQDVTALDKDKGVIVLAIGAIEQHGPHMPLVTDYAIAVEVARAAFRALDESVPAWCLPTLPYGKSNEHQSFPGTITLSSSTLIGVISDVTRSVHRAGFRRILYLSAHGGNNALLEMVARDLRVELGIMTFLTMPQPMTPEDRAALSALEQEYGIHANHYETSMMLGIWPELVHMDKATAHYPDFPGKLVKLTSMNQGRSPLMSWLTKDWSPLGHFGDPTKANAEAGQHYLRQAGERLAELIAEIAFMEVAHG